MKIEEHIQSIFDRKGIVKCISINFIFLLVARYIKGGRVNDNKFDVNPPAIAKITTTFVCKVVRNNPNPIVKMSTIY